MQMLAVMIWKIKQKKKNSYFMLWYKYKSIGWSDPFNTFGIISTAYDLVGTCFIKSSITAYEFLLIQLTDFFFTLHHFEIKVSQGATTTPKQKLVLKSKLRHCEQFQDPVTIVSL